MCKAQALRGRNCLTEKTFPLLPTSFYSYQQVNCHLYEWMIIINCKNQKQGTCPCLAGMVQFFQEIIHDI